MVKRRAGVLVTIVLICLAAVPWGWADETSACGDPADIGDGWPIGSQAAAGLDARRLCDLVVELDNSPQDNVHAVLVVRAGRLVFEDYRSGPDQRWGQDLGSVAHRPETLHDLRSVSKSVTSLLVGIAIDRRLIAGVDEPVFSFFPDLADLRTPEKDAILVRHLLAMSSGIAWDENSRPPTDPKHDEIRMIRSPNSYRFVLEQPLATQPDRIWNYSGGSTQLLAGIVQQASGQRFADFAREALFEPLEITDYEWVTMPDGETAAASGLRLRPRDMAKIGQLLLNEGLWNGRRIVSKEWLHESVVPRLSSSYGYQWWTGLSLVGEQVIERTEARGLGGQRIFVIPSLDLVVVTTAGLYVKTGVDNEGEITNGILDDFVLPSVQELAAVPQ